MNMKTFRQCRLAQNNFYTIGWIEDRGAKVGAFVEVDELGGLWEVIDVSSHSMTQNDLREKQRVDRGSLKSIK